MPKDVDVVPISEALKEIGGRAHDLGQWLYRVENWKLESRKGLLKFLEKLTQISLFLGPHNKEYREAVKCARECIDSIARIMRDYDDHELPEELRKEFDKQIASLIDVLTPEQKEKLGTTLEQRQP